MNLLLDTVTFLWIVEDSERLSATARKVLQDGDNVVFLSAVSAWEIAAKYQLGRLRLPQGPARLVRQQRELRGIEPLDISEAAVLRLGQLPSLHRDPFDRILACQAIEHSLTILTPDQTLRAYPVHSLW